MDKHEMTLGEYRDYCAEADARIASLTEAVRVLREALENVVAQIQDYERVNNLFPQPGKQDCWQSVTAARAALTTAKELTK